MILCHIDFSSFFSLSHPLSRLEGEGVRIRVTNEFSSTSFLAIFRFRYRPVGMSIVVLRPLDAQVQQVDHLRLPGRPGLLPGHLFHGMGRTAKPSAENPDGPGSQRREPQIHEDRVGTANDVRPNLFASILSKAFSISICKSWNFPAIPSSLAIFMIRMALGSPWMLRLSKTHDDVLFVIFDQDFSNLSRGSSPVCRGAPYICGPSSRADVLDHEPRQKS